jgi:hypothetical protein
MKMRSLPQRHRERREEERLGKACWRVTPLGNADGYQNKGLPGEAIRKNMKIKGEESDEWRVGRKSEGTPTPGAFA